MAKGAEFDPIFIRSQLAASLEPYKVPVYIEQIALIPRSFNGKLLRKKLLEL
jgi:acyl-CoA synthetase (AMP-forming)/AMP-acid ligase II